MKAFMLEIKEELTKVISGKTLDAMIPPFVFVIASRIVSLNKAITFSLVVAILIGLLRIMNKQNWRYAFAGLIGLSFASVLSYLTASAANYFIPKMISSGFGLLITVLSVLVGKPVAVFVSHLSRGWQLEWFWRKDIKPAYREVTLFWAFYFALRLGLLITLYIKEDVWSLVWMNTLLGIPATIIVLTLSYVYGIWRLKNLKGPGIEEYVSGKEKPWKGQTRGF
jgi:hypothetical protein